LKVAVTGVGGFVGGHLVRALAGRNHRLRRLVYRRRSSSGDKAHHEEVAADVHDVSSLIKAFEGIEAVYHLVGIIVETRKLTFEKTVAGGTENVVAACRECGVRRIVYLSAAGTGDEAETKYHQTKRRAEKTVIESGLDYTIFRPSLIFGPGDGFVGMLTKMITRSPVVVPVIGDGRYLLQPVYIDDLCEVMSGCLTREDCLGRIIEVGGPERLSYREILAILKRVLNKKKRNIYLPWWFMKMNAAILETFLKPAPLTGDQIKMLRSGNICDNSQLHELFDRRMTPFEEGLRKYMR